MTIRVSDGFLELYRSEEFGESITTEWMPWLLDGLDLGDNVLDLVAGVGCAIPAVRAETPRVTAAQTDPALTAELTTRYAADDAIEVVEVDPAQLPFPDNHFSAATAILTLHHLPSAADQDRALAELRRVVRPGGALAGFNAIDGPHLRRMDIDRTAVPIEPLGFAERLRKAGFVDLDLAVWAFMKFVGRAPTQNQENR